jgi:Putative MetA-pathway of phenol degradation
MSKTISSCALWAVLTVVLLPAAGRAADETPGTNVDKLDKADRLDKVDLWQFGSLPSFSSGKYGTDTRTEVLQTPFMARRLFDRGDITAVFPLTCVWGDGSVTLVNGVPVRPERLAFATTTRTGTTTVTSTTVTTRQCGMGDIVVRGRLYVVDEHGWLPTVAVRAHVKAPTASVEQGLGTGEPDEGAGLEISRTFVSRTTAMVDGGYTVIGKPAGVDYNNNWWYDLGIAQDVGSGVRPMVNLSLFFEVYRAIVPGMANGRDVLGTISVRGASGWRVQISGGIGLSSGAPEHSFMLGASRRF